MNEAYQAGVQQALFDVGITTPRWTKTAGAAAAADPRTISELLSALKAWAVKNPALAGAAGGAGVGGAGGLIGGGDLSSGLAGAGIGAGLGAGIGHYGPGLLSLLRGGAESAGKAAK